MKDRCPSLEAIEVSFVVPEGQNPSVIEKAMWQGLKVYFSVQNQPQVRASKKRERPVLKYNGFDSANTLDELGGKDSSLR